MPEIIESKDIPKADLEQEKELSKVIYKQLGAYPNAIRSTTIQTVLFNHIYHDVPPSERALYLLQIAQIALEECDRWTIEDTSNE